MSGLDRLLIIAGEPVRGLFAKGLTLDYKNRYYNPCSVFGQARILNVYQEEPIEGLTHRFIDVPAERDLHVWRDSISDPWQYEEVSEEMLRRYFPGVPESWVAAARDYAPDCIRGYDPGWPGFLSVELGRALGVPVVVSVHNTMGICGAVVKQAALVLAVSEMVAARCIELGADPARVVTLNDRVDRELFTPAGPVAAGPEGGPKLLWIAREHVQKNLDRTLEACAKAAKTYPGLKVVHFGRSTRDWSKWPFVTHRDAVPNSELPAWYRWSDALLLPSLWEGFGIVLAEALACGKPCITSNRPPMNDNVTDGWDGLLVDPENVDDIAAAICRMADPAVQARLAAPARTSSERFDVSRIERREAGLYRMLMHDQWPLISVVLPTYNRAILVEGAVRNVLAQDYSNFELIVVNDGSKDATGEVLNRIQAELGDARLRVINRENGGLPVALNTGFAQARGEFWTWTSDDNQFRPGALKALARELVLNPDCGLVYADMLVRDEKGREHRFVCGPPESIEAQCCVGGCFLYRASVARAVGEYDAEYTLAEDYDYWLRMRHHTAFHWLRRVLYEYADAPASLTRRRFAQAQAKRLQLLKREHGTRADWNDRKFEHLLQYSVYSKKYGMRLASVRTALRAWMLKPGSRRGWWALLRALTPRPILNLSRRLRGLDAG